MRTLDEFNRDRRMLHEMMERYASVKNGIACPECGGELVDSEPNTTLTSNPPQKRIHCPACSYSGLRIA
jgi:DNA-directed RNA polymerase subunit RPC12/RpoP